MKYVIYDGNNNYLFLDKSNKFKITEDINKATKWDDIQKVNNILDNNCKSESLKSFKWEAKGLSQKDDIIDVSVEPVEPITLKYDIFEKVKEICSFSEELEKRKLYLISEQSKIDLEIADIEHAAEFYNLSACQGYKLYRLLHDSRVKRREIKDELFKINLILGSSIKSSDMKNIESSIKGLDTRKYTPRINKELFGV